MSRLIETPVLVVGVGPVELCMALDLGWRGVEGIFIEQTMPYAFSRA
jgi:hypothetical protein